MSTANSKVATIPTTCSDCGISFLSFNSKQHRCKDCQQKHRNGNRGGYKYKKVCEDCGVVYRTSNHKSVKCPHCFTHGKCATCGVEFERKSSTQKYCSERCRRVSQYDFYYEGNWSKVLERDNHSCKKCGATTDLCVHHIDHSGSNNLKVFKSNNSLENLITLCGSCHKTLHIETYKYLVELHMKDVHDFFNSFIKGGE